MTAIYSRPMAALNMYPTVTPDTWVPLAALHDYVADCRSREKGGLCHRRGPSWRQVGVPLVSQTRLHPCWNRCGWAVDSLSAPLLWQFVIVPLWGIQTGMADNPKITSPSTIVSVIRGYAWRR